MIGSPILVIGIFWLGWTGQYENIPWYVPALSTIFLGVGISLIFMSFLVRRLLINITIFAHLYFLSSELPPGYISVGVSGVSDSKKIFLIFHIDYRMYSAFALSANAGIRSAVAAAFPLFTVQLFTNASRCSSVFVFYLNADCVGARNSWV